jgi:tripartite ATP-independent transporter DctM subunit
MSLAVESSASLGSTGSPTSEASGWLYRADRVLGTIAQIPAAILVIAEVIILFSGVMARYAFHTPLIWADELSSILFLWLAMMGSAVALHRGAHMRMTALVNSTGGRWKSSWDWVALTSCLAFLGLLAFPSFSYVIQQSAIRTPGLNILDAWRVSAIFIAVVLMIVIGTVKLLMTGRRPAIFGIVTAAAIAGVLHYTGPLLSDLGNLNLLIFFVGIVGFTVLSGMPIAFSFGLATSSYLSLSTSMPLNVVVGRMDEGVSQLILLAVPMFVFLGLLIEMTGMARTMVAFLASLLGHIRGGLSYVLVGSMYLVSGISGSKAADMAAVSPVLFPEMIKRGAKRGELVALLSATGAQTETIPPSIVLITIGSVTGVSITSLFIGGLMPGVVLGLTLCCLIWWRSRSNDMSYVQRASIRTIGKTLVVALPALMLPFVIRFAVVEGIATATEVSTVGIVYSVLVALLIYRRFDWRRLGPILVETAALSGAILMIIGTATAMAWALTQSGFSQSLATFMAELPGGKPMFLAVSVLAFIILGSVLEGIPAIVLFGPLLFPIARDIGVNEVQYAMVVILSMGLGLFAPPFGVGYYGACAVSQIHPDEGIRPIVGYMLALFIGIVVVAAVPWVSIGFLK